MRLLFALILLTVGQLAAVTIPVYDTIILSSDPRFQTYQFPAHVYSGPAYQYTLPSYWGSNWGGTIQMGAGNQDGWRIGGVYGVFAAGGPIPVIAHNSGQVDCFGPGGVGQCIDYLYLSDISNTGLIIGGGPGQQSWVGTVNGLDSIYSHLSPTLLSLLGPGPLSLGAINDKGDIRASFGTYGTVVLTSTPEPGTWILLSTLLIGLWMTRRSRTVKVS